MMTKAHPTTWLLTAGQSEFPLETELAASY